MAQYIITYLGGNQPSTPEEGKAHFTKYSEWLASLVILLLVQLTRLRELRQ